MTYGYFLASGSTPIRSTKATVEIELGNFEKVGEMK